MLLSISSIIIFRKNIKTHKISCIGIPSRSMNIFLKYFFPTSAFSLKEYTNFQFTSLIVKIVLTFFSFCVRHTYEKIWCCYFLLQSKWACFLNPNVVLIFSIVPHILIHTLLHLETPTLRMLQSC